LNWGKKSQGDESGILSKSYILATNGIFGQWGNYFTWFSISKGKAII